MKKFVMVEINVDAIIRQNQLLFDKAKADLGGGLFEIRGPTCVAERDSIQFVIVKEADELPG